MNTHFALENPIEVITGKKRSELTRDDLINIINKKQIERITFHYTAIDGRVKELRLPITSHDQAELILAEGERVDSSSLFRVLWMQANLIYMLFLFTNQPSSTPLMRPVWILSNGDSASIRQIAY